MFVAAARSSVGRHSGTSTTRVYPCVVFASGARRTPRGPGRAPERGSRRGSVDIGSLRRLFSFTRPYARLLGIGVLSVAVAGVLGLAFPLVVRRLLDAAFVPGAAPGSARAALDSAVVLLVGLVLLQAAFNYLRTYCLGRTGEAVVADLRKAVFSHLIGLDVPFFERRKTGELVSRLTADVATVQSAVSQALAQVVNQGVHAQGTQRVEVELDDVVRIGLEHYLILVIVLQAVGIVAVATVGRAP